MGLPPPRTPSSPSKAKQRERERESCAYTLFVFHADCKDTGQGRSACAQEGKGGGPLTPNAEQASKQESFQGVPLAHNPDERKRASIDSSLSP